MTAETMHAFLRSRRSVRRFLPNPVPEEAIGRILETATWAPSSHNRQPWRFVVLSSLSARARLAEAMGEPFRRDLLAGGMPAPEAEAAVERSRRRIQGAPLAILLCLDASLGDSYPDPRRRQAEHLMGVQSVALAGGWLLLAAHAEGLGGVWVCAPLFAPEAARRALELSVGWEPQGLLLMGYPQGLPPARPRQAVNEVARFL